MAKGTGDFGVDRNVTYLDCGGGGNDKIHEIIHCKLVHLIIYKAYLMR